MLPVKPPRKAPVNTMMRARHAGTTKLTTNSTVRPYIIAPCAVEPRCPGWPTALPRPAQPRSWLRWYRRNRPTADAQRPRRDCHGIGRRPRRPSGDAKTRMSLFVLRAVPAIGLGEGCFDLGLEEA